jgi:hypothetical protein
MASTQAYEIESADNALHFSPLSLALPLSFYSSVTMLAPGVPFTEVGGVDWPR